MADNIELQELSSLVHPPEDQDKVSKMVKTKNQMAKWFYLTKPLKTPNTHLKIMLTNKLANQDPDRAKDLKDQVPTSRNQTTVKPKPV
jgi:hypothetical protein